MLETDRAAMTPRRRAPVWLMGMTMLPFGLLGGLVPVTIPQLLAARNVPESHIAALTALAMSPAFWGFLISPMLDVRFSRRSYAAVTAVIAAVATPFALWNLGQPGLLVALLLVAEIATMLMQNALGGWFSTVLTPEEKPQLSAWMMVANIGGAGLMVLVSITLIDAVTLPVAAVLFGVAELIPIAIYPFIPTKTVDTTHAGESFARFFRDIAQLFRRRDVLIALAIFVLPSGSFTLINVLGGLGSDFHASPQMLSLVGGVGIICAGIVGSLILPPLARKFPLRPLYLGIGIIGGLFTLSLLLLPRTPTTLAAAFVGEGIFQALAFTCGFAITFEAVGHDNPVAATTFSVILAASNLPVVYMVDLDGMAAQAHGVTGAFLTDGVLGIASCVFLALMLVWLRARKRKQLKPRSAT